MTIGPKIKKLYYGELSNNYWVYLSLLAGGAVILAQAANILLS